MKESDRLTDGQIVSYKYRWLACYKAAGNHLLFQFADYMEIYNNAWQASDVLANDRFLANAIGVIGEIAPSLEPYLGGFAHKKDIIATDQRIEEFKP
jgi:hypothetical protein